MLQRLKADRWLILAALLLLLLPLPKLMMIHGLLPEGSVNWPPTHYMQRGTEIFVWAVFAISYDLLMGFT